MGRHCELVYSITLPLHDGVLVRLLILLTVVVATGFGMHVDWLRRAHGGSSVSTRSIRWSSPLPHWCSAQSVGRSTLSLEWSLSSWVERPELFSQTATATTANHGSQLRFCLPVFLSMSISLLGQLAGAGHGPSFSWRTSQRLVSSPLGSSSGWTLNICPIFYTTVVDDDSWVEFRLLASNVVSHSDGCDPHVR